MRLIKCKSDRVNFFVINDFDMKQKFTLKKSYIIKNIL